MLPTKSKPFVFGITGSIACGKSTASKFFRQAGIPIVDADIVAREVVEPFTIGWNILREHFGKSFFNEDDSLNRVALADLVFSNQLELDFLNSNISPLVSKESQRQIQSYHDQGNKIIGFDASLIIEMGNAELYRPLIVIVTPEDTQIARLMKRNDLTEAEARNRISKQLSSAQKAEYADIIIDTSGTLEELKIKVIKSINLITEKTRQ
jgi:dephospho-CoA kinase